MPKATRQEIALATVPLTMNPTAVPAILRPGEFSIHHECTVHGSEANASDKRRIGFSGIYCSPEMRSTIGRRGANLVRGKDRYGHWDEDPEPRFDLDPVCVQAAAACNFQQARILVDCSAELTAEDELPLQIGGRHRDARVESDT